MCLYMPAKIMRFDNINEKFYDTSSITKEWEERLDSCLISGKHLTFHDVYNAYKVCKLKIKARTGTDANECVKLLKNGIISILENRRYGKYLLNMIDSVCRKYDPFTMKNSSEPFKLICAYDCNCINHKVDILFLLFEKNLTIEYNLSFSKESLCIYISIIQRFMDIIEIKDAYTRKHSERVNFIAKKFGSYLLLQDDELDELDLASILHDIGKIGISQAVLTKKGQLTDVEYDVIKKHTEYGELMAKKIPGFDKISNIIKYHHERYDGKGYYNLESDSISRNMYIIALCDTFDSMNSDRPYRKALSFDTIIEEYKRCSGKQFEPELCDKFVTFLIRNINDIRKAYT